VTAYEKRDLRFSAIAQALGGLAILLAAVALSSSATLRVLSRHYPSVVRRRPPPPEPRLQADPAGDLRARRAEEDAELKSCAWVDRSRGVIRLPIERAMSLVLLRGLPTRDDGVRRAP
jgi:hypothetical protein